MTLVVLSLPGETDRIVSYEGWRDPTFVALYAATSFMGERVESPQAVPLMRRLSSRFYDITRGQSKTYSSTWQGIKYVGCAGTVRAMERRVSRSADHNTCEDPQAS